jgi:hypothetical protein
MSFPKAFQRKITAVQIRCGLNLLLRQAGCVLAIAGAIAALAVLAEHLLAVRIVVPAALWGFWGVVAALTLVLWFRKLPSRMQASLLLDERLRLHERSSTTLALADSEDPFARAAREESLRAVQRADLRGHFPIGLPRSWYYGAGTWLVVIAVVLFMPEKDLLGLLKKKQQQEQEVKKLEEAKAEVKQAAESVKAAVKELHEPTLEEALKKLDEVAQAGQPQEAKREAIKALGDLSDKLKQMQGSTQLDAANMMEQTLRRLRGSADPFSQQVRMALAKGDFARAANLLSQLQKELMQGKLSDQQREDMAKQLQQLAKELAKLAEQKRELEEELQKLGLDKKLAELSEQKLRQTLQQQGLTPDLVDQVMKKMAASQAAAGKCAGLGMAMAACGAGTGGLSADDLADAIDQLNALESLQQQAMLLQGSLNEIGRGIALLGTGLYEGVGSQQPFREGYSDGMMGPGSGGLGSGFGPRSSDTEGQTGTKPARANTASGQGAVIASWYFKDVQIKGEARRDFTEVVEAGRANAAEAISENQIPRKYEEAMKKYFGQLEQHKPQP